MSVLVAENLVKIYRSKSEDVRAVNGVSLYVDAGEVVCLMGPSGTGKTTLLTILGCILAPDDGELRVCGQKIVWNESILPDYRRKYFGFIAQRSTLMSSLDVLENIEIPLLLHGKGASYVDQRCAEVLQTVNLSHRSRFNVGVLSGGERQRVAIARALAADPSILLCDEPTASLDSKTGHQIISMLRHLADVHRKAVLIVTHDDRLLEYANRVYHMSDGQVREEILKTPASQHTLVQEAAGEL